MRQWKSTLCFHILVCFIASAVILCHLCLSVCLSISVFLFSLWPLLGDRIKCRTLFVCLSVHPSTCLSGVCPMPLIY